MSHQPPPESPLVRVDTFLSQSRELLKLAQAGDWVVFEGRLREREQGLPALAESRFLIEVAKSGLADEVKQRIAEIQVLNDQITALAEQGKAALNGQLRQIVQADKALSAYKK